MKRILAVTFAAVALATSPVDGASAVGGTRWPQNGYGPEHRGYNSHETTITSANAGRLRRVWRLEYDGAATPPVVDGTRVFFGAGDSMHGIDLQTGVEQWSTAIMSTIIAGQLRPGAPILTGDGRVTAPIGGGVTGGEARYDRVTGTESHTESFHTGPLEYVARGDVTVSTFFSILTPSVVHGLNYGVPHPTLLGRTITAPTLVDSDVLVGGDLSVLAYRVRTCNPYPVDDPDVCLPRVTVDLPAAPNTPVGLPGGRAALSARDGTVRVVDIETLGTLWESSIPSTIEHAPAMARGRLYAAAEDGTIYTLKADGCGAGTCMPRPKYTLAGSPSGQPVVAGDVLYVGTDDGRVSAYATDTCPGMGCAPLWSVDTGARPISGLVVVNGTVIATTRGGKVLAWRVP